MSTGVGEKDIGNVGGTGELLVFLYGAGFGGGPFRFLGFGGILLLSSWVPGDVRGFFEGVGGNGLCLGGFDTVWPFGTGGNGRCTISKEGNMTAKIQCTVIITYR